ncbi:transcription antitermination factor NusB [Vallitaleaceae bacterium 9-2]
MNRHKQRELTFKLLFSLDVDGTHCNVEDIDVSLQSLELKDEEDQQLIKTRVLKLVEYVQPIDQLIEACSDKWAIDRIAKIELAILRVAVFDMQYDDVPVSVAINEAVELSKIYGQSQSSRFVNGVLGQIAKKIV